MGNQLKKAIEIARKTGDRLIIYDSSREEEPYVVMSLNEYEKLVIGRSEVRGLTEDELLDKINRDIAIWKSEQFIDNEPEIKPTRRLIEDDIYKNIPDFFEIEEKLKEKKKSRRSWMIPSQRKEAAEEVIDEDRQYLENIE